MNRLLELPSRRRRNPSRVSELTPTESASPRPRHPSIPADLPEGTWFPESSSATPEFLRSESYTSDELFPGVWSLDTTFDRSRTRHTEGYTYSDLPGGNWIRLLRLLPGALGDSIHIELLAVELENAPPFETISYCWGASDHREIIQCCGEIMKVTTTLFGALRRFRDASKETILWADAVCIDQDNIRERGQQVSLMGRIYSDASTVLVWLGEDTYGDTPQAIQLIKDVNEYCEVDYLRSWESHRNAYNPLYSPVAFLRDGPLLDKSRWKAFDNLILRPWFSRVWVLQEAGLARRAIAYVGEMSIALADIIQICLLHNYRPDLQYHVPLISPGRVVSAFALIWSGFSTGNDWLRERPILQKLLHYHRSSLNFDFADVLGAAAQFQCTDPRDHVFAFLGHPRAIDPLTKRPMIEPDYEMPYEEVAIEAAYRCCVTTDSLQTLTWVYHPTDSHLNEYASWAPNWGMSVPTASIDSIRQFNACLAAQTEKEFVVERSGHSLRTCGIIFDAVDAWSDTIFAGDFGKASLIDHRHPELSYTNPLEMCWEVIGDSPSVYNHRGKYFIETLTTNKSSSRTRNIDLAGYCRKFCTPGFWESLNLPTNSSADEVAEGDWKRLLRTFEASTRNRKFFTTREGRFGIGPHIMRTGDVCCILYGATVPFIIRPVEGFRYKLLGECYIEGVMDGEVVTDLLRAKREMDRKFVKGSRRTKRVVQRRDIILV